MAKPNPEKGECQRCGQLMFNRPSPVKFPSRTGQVIRYICDPCQKELHNVINRWWYSGAANQKKGA